MSCLPALKGEPWFATKGSIHDGNDYRRGQGPTTTPAKSWPATTPTTLQSSTPRANDSLKLASPPPSPATRRSRPTPPRSERRGFRYRRSHPQERVRAGPAPGRGSEWSRDYGRTGKFSVCGASLTRSTPLTQLARGHAPRRAALVRLGFVGHHRHCSGGSLRAPLRRPFGVPWDVRGYQFGAGPPHGEGSERGRSKGGPEGGAACGQNLSQFAPVRSRLLESG